MPIQLFAEESLFTGVTSPPIDRKIMDELQMRSIHLLANCYIYHCDDNDLYISIIHDYDQRAAKELPAAPVNPKADFKYVQRVDCTKRVPSTIIKAINTTVQGPHKTLPAQTKVKVITSTTTMVETKFPGKVTKYSTTTTSPTTTVWSTITSGSVTTELGELVSFGPGRMTTNR
ncbi:hypothetical protein DER44DRAFT_898760 [Fusarium oxysporum]|nr:hypothetical protein DER44DRAFT_898760 [Fusarium oxysporum]